MHTPRYSLDAREEAHLSRFLTKVSLRVSSYKRLGHDMVVLRNHCPCFHEKWHFPSVKRLTLLLLIFSLIWEVKYREI